MFKIYTVKETAAKTGIPERSVRRYISNGTNGFPSLQVVVNGKPTNGATAETIATVRKLKRN